MLTATKSFANPRIERVTRDGKEIDVENGAVQPGDTFDPGDALYARDLIRNGLAEGEVSDEEADNVELQPHYTISEGQLAASRARKSGGKVDPLARNISSASAQPRPSTAPAKAAAAPAKPAE